MKYNSEERIGVYSIAKIFTEELKWIFREQPINDFGIDGFVEITSLNLKSQNQEPTGKLFGVQIKSGKSYFKEEDINNFIFRGSIKHLDYWLSHSIPVVLVIYNKELNISYWQEVNKNNISLTKKSFKIKIPKKNTLCNLSKEELINIAYFKSKYEYRLWQLQYSIDEINILMSQKLFLYIELEKFYPDKYSMTLLITNEDSDDYAEIIHRMFEVNPIRSNYSILLSAENNLQEALEDTIPWADFSLNNSKFTDEKLVFYIKNELMEVEYFHNSSDLLQIVENNDFWGLALFLTESYTFKLRLTANELSYAFIKLNSFLNKEPSVKQRIFI